MASLPASSVLPGGWRSRWALCCCFGERSLSEGQGKVLPSSVHIPIWLQKAGESAPDFHFPVSAALSLHAGLHMDTPGLPVLSPALTTGSTNVPFCLQRQKALSYLQQSVTTVRLLLYYFKPCLLIHWERVDFAKLRHHLLVQKLLE